MNVKLLTAIALALTLSSCASVYNSEGTNGTRNTGASTRPSTGTGTVSQPVTSSTAPAPERKSVPLWGQYYTVKKSEGLYRIAVYHGLLMTDLAVWNGLSEPYSLNPGQRLRLFPPTGAQNSTASTPINTGAPASSGFAWAWPASGNIVSWFQPGEPTKQGIGISGRVGEPIKAAADGVVVYSGNGLVGYGELVIIKHNDQWLSAYGHNRNRLVKENDRVTRGQTIAEMGTSNGQPQLHFEIRYNGKPVDPRTYLPAQR